MRAAWVRTLINTFKLKMEKKYFNGKGDSTLDAVWVDWMSHVQRLLCLLELVAGGSLLSPKPKKYTVKKKDGQLISTSSLYTTFEALPCCAGDVF